MELALGMIGRQTLAVGKMELALGRTDQQLADDARRTLGTQGELGASRTTAERRKRKEVLLPNAFKPNATEQQKQKEEREGGAAQQQQFRLEQAVFKIMVKK